MFCRYAITIVICYVCLVEFGNSSRILAICPRASISHQIVLRGLTLALNERGHELVVVTTDPVNDPSLKNYTEIDISFLYNSNTNSAPDTTQFTKLFKQVCGMLDLQTRQILSHPELRKLYAPNSNEKFDLILLELLFWPAFLPLGKRFDAPIIGYSPMGLALNVQYTFGNPIMTSHPSNWELYTDSESSSFYHRVEKFINYWTYIYYYKTIYTPAQEAIARKYFGDDIPDLHELEKNVSLVFANQQTAISYVKANVPKIIEINGFHLSKQIKPLPKDLQKILDEATQGFVYMSLGSNLKSSMLSPEIQNEFIAAFSRLPYKVLWKYENDALPGKPDNVHIMKWIPQQAVLAHPNLKVFVYQGGLQSTEEAVSNAVPIVGIPTWVDQRMQVNKLVSLGVAKKLLMSTINRNDLEEAILTVASDKSYKESMLYLRTLLKDRSQDLLDNAIWWLEYVIRHKGAPHLHSTTADDPWYRRQDMDVIAFMASGSTIVLGLMLYVFYRLLRIACRNISYNALSVDERKKFS